MENHTDTQGTTEGKAFEGNVLRYGFSGKLEEKKDRKRPTEIGLGRKKGHHVSTRENMEKMEQRNSLSILYGSISPMNGRYVAEQLAHKITWQKKEDKRISNNGDNNGERGKKTTLEIEEKEITTECCTSNMNSFWSGCDKELVTIRDQGATLRRETFGREVMLQNEESHIK